MPSEEKDDAPTKKKSEGITVFLRMRPTKHPSKFYDVGDNEGKGQSLRWDIPPDAVTKDGEYINNTKTQWAFKFDQVLPMDISQAQVFDRVGKNVVQNALDGYNSTVFAYGQTGSGKTFTITGGSERYEDRGIIPRALSMIFQAFRERSDCSWSAHVSYMEIYNEQGFDLLNESSGAKALQDLPRVRMMEDEHGPRRRPVVQRRLHAIDATRIHQTRSWVVSFLILRPFGPRRAGFAEDRRLWSRRWRRRDATPP